MSNQIVTVIIVLIILYFWIKDKNMQKPEKLEPLKPETIPLTPGENVTKQTGGGVPYNVAPITIPLSQSPYYWDEATWQRLFNSHAFTNPEVAVDIYSRRDPNNPEYR